MKIEPYKVKRGANFVLGLGTKVVPDKKKAKNKKECRKPIKE
jgi:hypothetical protein